MSFFVAFVCFTTVVILVKLIFDRKNRRLYDLLRQFPSHPAYPIVGNAYSLFGSFKDVLAKGSKIVEPYDSQVYWLGPIPCVVLKKYDDIVTVVTQTQDRDSLGIMIEMFGLGLITARYKEWKTSRRILNPAFGSEMLSKYFQVFQTNAAILTESLTSVADTGEVVDVLHWMTDTSLNSIVENSMGILIQQSGKTGENFIEAIHGATDLFGKRFTLPWLLQRHIFKLYLKISGKTRLIEYFHHLPNKVFKKILNNSRNLQNTEDKPVEANSSKVIIDILVKKHVSDADFTESRVTGELVNMIFAGSETTSLAISFLLVMLAVNQDIQQKLYEEINQQLSNANEILTEDDLTALQYLDQCVKETLRRFSPVQLTFRRTHKDILLKDNKIIPANVIVLPLIYFANQDPQLYENPLNWDPEHFNEQAVKNRPKASQISFLCGPRNCIGHKYAMLMMKTTIIYILRKYQLSTNIKGIAESDLYADLSIRSKLGYPVKFKSRPTTETLEKN